METRNLTCIGCPMGCPLTVKIENGTVDRKSDGIQYWRLTWNPKEHVGTLIRVNLRRKTDG